MYRTLLRSSGLARHTGQRRMICTAKSIPLANFVSYRGSAAQLSQSVVTKQGAFYLGRRLVNTSAPVGGRQNRDDDDPEDQDHDSAVSKDPEEEFLDARHRNVGDDEGEVDDVEHSVNNILYDAPVIKQDVHRHVLSALVENEPGVLSRISGLLAARGFNIDSLVVCGTEIRNLSRMTMVMRGGNLDIEQARRQLEDLVHVFGVVDFSDIKFVERELLLIKVRTNPHVPARRASSKGQAQKPRMYTPAELQAISQQRHAVTELAKLFEAKIVDIGEDHLIVELTTWSRRVDAFMKLCKPFGIIEASRTGLTAMARSSIGSLHDGETKVRKQIDIASLPPS
eukprot:Clim_evm27s229 gene=Clim_evmTU27s229